MNWRTLAKNLADTLQRKIVTLDTRNHGDSPHTAEMEYEYMAADVEGMIGQLNKGSPVIIIGHSLGGRIGMTMALSPAANLIEKLIIADVAPAASNAQIQSSTTPKYVKILNAIQLQNYSTRSEVELFLQDKIINNVDRKFLLTNIIYNKGRLSWKINLAAIESNLDRLTSIPKVKPGTSYNKEVLFLVGENSDRVRAENISEIKELFPNYELRSIANAGHLLHVEQPTTFCDTIAEFLSMPEQ